MLLFKISIFQVTLMLKLCDQYFLIIISRTAKILMFISFKIRYNWWVINHFAYQPYNQLKMSKQEERFEQEKFERGQLEPEQIMHCFAAPTLGEPASSQTIFIQ